MTSEKKSKAMHIIHPATRVSATKETEVVTLKLKHVCDSSSRTFPTPRGPKRWCEGGLTQFNARVEDPKQTEK